MHTSLKPDAHAALYERVKKKLDVGLMEQNSLLNRVANMVIRDKLVSPKAMFFDLGDASDDLRIVYGANTAEKFSIHRHALKQLSEKVKIPNTYVNELRSKDERWRSVLLMENFNQLFSNTVFSERSGPARFLHRIVGNELRGFLSRKFNRHIASSQLLRSFVESCARMGAFPFEATATDVKVALKCMLPEVYEPVKGQFVCAGVEWSNSDFGAGRMQVALTLWMPNVDRALTLDHVISRIHIGSIIEDSDLELSEETAQKEAEVQCSATKDAVENYLSPTSLNRMFDAIEAAHLQEVPWEKLKGQLPKFLSKQDLTDLAKVLEEDCHDLPPLTKNNAGTPIPTKWWASTALAWLANQTKDPERRFDLQHAAGSLLDVG